MRVLKDKADGCSLLTTTKQFSISFFQLPHSMPSIKPDHSEKVSKHNRTATTSTGEFRENKVIIITSKADLRFLSYSL